MNPLDSLFTLFSPLLSSPFCFLLLAIAMVGAAASSCYASPLCTFFVAACMSLSHGGGGGDTRQPLGRSRRRRQQLGKCSGSGSVQEALVSSCLEFKPCSHYNKNNKGNAFTPLLFGSNSLSLNRKQRKLNRATTSSSGIIILSLFLCVKFGLFMFHYTSLSSMLSWVYVIIGKRLKAADLESQLKCEVGFFYFILF